MRVELPRMGGRVTRHCSRGTVWTIVPIACFSFLVASSTASAKSIVPVRIDAAPANTPAEILNVIVQDDSGVLGNSQVWVEDEGGNLLAHSKHEPKEGFVAEAFQKFFQLFFIPVHQLLPFHKVHTNDASGVAITAYAPNHIPVTVLDVGGQTVTITLPTIPKDEFAMMAGKVRGFNAPPGGGEGQVGFVAKALEMSDLASIETSSFISPVNDTIDVFGERKIPSNIVLPQQTLYYYLIPIRLNKPNYRLPLLAGSSHYYFAVEGFVEVKEAIDRMKSDNPASIADVIEFRKIGVTSLVRAPTNGGQMNLDLQLNFSLNEKISVKPGRNLTPDKESKRLLVAVHEAYPGVFVPTDVKQAVSSRIQVKTVNKTSAKLIDVIVSEKTWRVRGAWLPSDTKQMPDVGITGEIQYTGIDGRWLVNSPATTNMAIVRLETERETSIKSKRIEDQWIVIAPKRDWVGLPPVAYRALQAVIGEQLGKISHVSLDLIETKEGGYPLVDGAKVQTTLQVLEKVRRKAN